MWKHIKDEGSISINFAISIAEYGVFSNTSTITVPSIIFVFPCLFSDCVNLNSHVNKLRGTKTKNVPGWNLDNVNRGSVIKETHENCRDGNCWYGFLSGYRIGSISTTLRGCGVAKLDFGECAGYYTDDSTKVYLNGKEIGRAGDQLSKTIEFNFKDGDILELKEGDDHGIIRFNSFTVISCC